MMTPNMMNPEFSRQPPLNLGTRVGNAANGSKVNRPTIVNQRCGTKAPNLFPSFETTPYNNSAQSFSFPLFNTFVENTVNPIGTVTNPPGSGNTGLSGNGSNQNGAGYKPLDKSYRLSQLGAISGPNQTFPYLTSQMYPQGMINFHHPVYYGINQGEPETYTNGVDIPRGMPSQQISIQPHMTPAQERATQYRSANAVNVAQRYAVNRLAANRIYNQRDAQDRRLMSAPVQMQMVYN